MIFMKKNEEGIIVPMDEGDYKQIFEDPYKKVYIFQKNLEMILCDYKVIFNHRLGKPYASTLTYYRINNVFTIQHENGFMLICHEEGKWKVYLRSRSGYLNLYTQDSEGRYLELGENNYYISFGPRGFLRYEFKSDVNCSKVMFKDKLVWRRNSNEPCPSKINITLRKDIIVHFGDYYIIFVKKKGYKKSYKKAIIKSHRHK
ncbi:hypothetical protein TpMuguga_02g00003 [Theileria parva strain Muguga]|uniref:uncharacterized protein n=1 Tax=Theileria parva strain Muguga TaxID=333668 RepID=UPI001C61E8CE|nr:uncharacterized protein TpMuguga_02g00003 [Theileria parva strain Muguga]KAF5153558.1 hypothetical protein TpMuguga_02g00003 [Theileria parva strain Muguga]